MHIHHLLPSSAWVSGTNSRLPSPPPPPGLSYVSHGNSGFPAARAKGVGALPGLSLSDAEPASLPTLAPVTNSALRADPKSLPSGVAASSSPSPTICSPPTARVMFSTHKLDYVIYWLKTHQCLPVSLGLKSRFLISACLKGPVGTACYLSGLISHRTPLASVCALAAWPPCCSWTRTHTLLSWDMCLLFFCPERSRRCRARSCASFRSPLKCHPVGELP